MICTANTLSLNIPFLLITTGEDEVTYGAVKEMDLIVDLVASGALTEQALVNFFRKAGGHMASAVNDSTLDLQVRDQ